MVKSSSKHSSLIAVLCLFLAFIICPDICHAKVDMKAFTAMGDSLSVQLEKRTGIKSGVSFKNITTNGIIINFSFNASIGDYTWHKEDIRWFRSEIQRLLPAEYKNHIVGELRCLKRDLNRYVTPRLGNDGSFAQTEYRIEDRRGQTPALVRRENSEKYTKGLDGRHIALWQSHGRYYEQKLGRWEWQRATIFETVEDLFTQSFVVPFLTPMLENAGAVVMMPRERDMNPREVISDNDKDWMGIANYRESGNWSDAGTGFCNKKEYYSGLDNPFTMGSVRKAAQNNSGNRAVWSADIPERGRYAVYISYKTLENSSDCAHYTVHHLGGETSFRVNQTMGGGMWVYLGHFDFDKGLQELVSLDASLPKSGKSGSKVITADAVKIGGGMGNIARRIETSTDSMKECSGMPRFTEGARYWLQWSGFDQSVWNLNEQKHDYRDDFMCRGPWVQHLSAGSRVNPDEKGKNIPVDLSFAFHTDAGTRSGDDIVGTLAIYTLLKDNKEKYTDGSNRTAAREYTCYVQDQIVNDIRATFEPQWNKRQVWDRSYSESRMPNVPAMLLELLSHQNFADMKYGLDPAFRFTVSRAIYKGILKFLSNRYACGYIVQPLPVNSFSAAFARNSDGSLSMPDDSSYTVRLKWKDSPDSLEPTAVADHYLLYTKIDEGGWDNGVRISRKEMNGLVYTDCTIKAGSRYSWKIEACNDGGRSFPSRVMSAGIPYEALSADRKSLIRTPVLNIDNFDRVAGPSFYDSPEYAGFDNRTDGGIGYVYDCSYIGDMYEWHRVQPWVDDDCPGFGGSYVDYADKIIAGNTFDWSEKHGKLIYNCGYAYCSASSDAFAAMPELGDGIYAINLICGKQVTTICGTSRYGYRHEVFPSELQDAIRQYAAKGGNIIVSGSYIGTDAWSYVYPVRIDKEKAEASQKFCREVFGYAWRSNFGSRSCQVKSSSSKFAGTSLGFCNSLNDKIYKVDSPDGIIAADSRGETILRYKDSNVSAAVLFKDGNRKCISFGFPLECINEDTEAQKLMHQILENLFL